MSWKRSQWTKHERPHCNPSMDTMYRSLLGQKNGCRIRHNANVATSSTEALNGSFLDTLASQIKWRPVKLQYWPHTTPLRILGLHDASKRNNDDGTRRVMEVFLEESRERSSRDGMTCGNLDRRFKDCALHFRGKAVSLMKCFGSCEFLPRLWMDNSGEVANIHMGTGSKRLVTTARTIHFREIRSTWLPCCKKTVQEEVMTLLTFQHWIAEQIASQRLQSRRTIWSQPWRQDIAGCWNSTEFQNTTGHMAFSSTWCRTLFAQKEREVFLLHS